MKITQFNLKIFVDELRSLGEMIPDVETTAEQWLKYQERRDKWGWQDQEGTAAARGSLEARLTEIRDKMATVYDFMGDRGLTNFEPTILEASENGREGYDAGGSEQDPQQRADSQEPPERGTAGLVQRLRERNQTSSTGGQN
jgi:hypothetical protein